MAVQLDYKRKLFENVVEQCFFCENYWKGCRAFFTEDKDLEDHKQGCAFRLVYCPSVGCQKNNDYLKIQSKDWTDHLTAIHGVAVYSFVPDIPQSIPLSLKLLSCNSWFLRLKLNNRVDFFLIGKVEYDCLHLWVSIFGSQLEAMNYCYTLSNEDKDGLGSTCSGYVNTLDDNPSEIITEQDLFKVGLENATKMEAENRGLKVTIHALKERPKRMTLKWFYCRFVPFKNKRVWAEKI